MPASNVTLSSSRWTSNSQVFLNNPELVQLGSWSAEATSSTSFQGSSPNFSPGQINSIGVPLPVTVTSLPYQSFHNVVGLQFATSQSPPVELIPNDQFQDSAHYLTYTWGNVGNDWTVFGAANVAFNVNTNSAIISHNSVATSAEIGHTLIRPPVAPVMAENAQPVSGDNLAGLISPPIVTSPNGRLYAAIQFTPVTLLNAPLYLQIYDGTQPNPVPGSSALLMQWEIASPSTQQQSLYFPFDVGDYAAPNIPLQIAVIQNNTGPGGASAMGDIWSIQSLSLYDEGIYWQFATDGQTFYPGMGIKNNYNGMMTFPVGGNTLVWKATFYQPNMFLNEVEIRPIYQGYPFFDIGIGRKGPNVEFTDNYISIYTDPLFSEDPSPIPRPGFLPGIAQIGGGPPGITPSGTGARWDVSRWNVGTWQ